jgi:site-specific DNA-cytosine methylase
MNTVELFCGTKSFSKVMAKHGHSTLTIDNDIKLNPDLCIDVIDLLTDRNLLDVDIFWASPPCTSFSVAGRKTNYINFIPQNEKAKKNLELVLKTLELINKIKPKYPMGYLRKFPFMEKLNRVTVSYCQYGDTRMKPTDIWTNLPNWKGKFCKNGAPCHERAPRGSKTGTQGLKGARERGVIPEALFEEILEVINNR